MSRLRPAWVVSGLMAIALPLRLYRLDSGLWLDEVYTWVRFMGLPLHAIPAVYGSENQHFLYSILAKASLLIFGESVWAFRLPAALFGVAGIGAMYLFGREAASETEGLLSAALLTFSYHHVWFSQNARGYTGLLFWTLLSSWLLLRALRERSSRLWTGYALAAALGVYTQATIVFVLAGHAVVAAYDCWKRREISGPLLGFGLGAALAVLLHAPALPEIASGLKGAVSVVTEWRNPRWTLSELASGVRIGFSGAAAGIAALALFAGGMWSFLRTKPAVIALLVIPPLVGASLLLLLGHHIWPRFFLFSFGFAALVAIRGAMLFGRAGVALALAMIALSAASVPFAYGPKQDYDGALRFVRDNRREGDAVVTTDLATWVYGRYYHAGFTAVESAAQLDAVRRRAGRTWLIYTLEPVFAAQFPDLHAAARRECAAAATFRGTLHNGDVVVCLCRAGGSL